jgi:hypothetical protein
MWPQAQRRRVEGGYGAMLPPATVGAGAYAAPERERERVPALAQGAAS